MSCYRKILLTVIIFASQFAFCQQPSEPTLKSLGSMAYPPLARAARIQGEVQLQLFLNYRGQVVSVTLLSGHPMLAPAAEEYVKKWEFAMPEKASRDELELRTLISFELIDDADFSSGRTAKIITDSFRRIRIITASPSRIEKSECPSEKQRQPPHGLAADDFVEMSRSGCYGTCPIYKVRLQADGSVVWDGGGFVVEKRRSSAHVGSQLATDLIAKFAAADFWALCGSYSQSVTDSATTTFRVKIGSRTKAVSNYANSAPDFLNDLEYAIDETADTHRWLHGDPREEPLSFIEDDGYGPKPGLTPLMKAAARTDHKQVQQLLRAGADPNQADSSGWTALMYARIDSYRGGAHIFRSELIRELVAAGADPNYLSPHGESALMAQAFDRRFEEELVRAEANVNQQNNDGVSTLMILASFGEADEIAKALQAGANPNLKDVQGRTALDYLNRANCDESPLRNPVTSNSTHEGGECRALGQEDYHRSEQLLNSAMPH